MEGLLPIFIEYVMPTIATVIGLGVTWLLTRLEQKFGLDVEAQHRESLQKALENAAGLLIRTMGDRVSLPESPAFRAAISYVERAAPDAIRFFGITPESIAEKVEAQVGKLLK